MTDLLTRLREAKEGSRELDAEIGRALTGTDARKDHWFDFFGTFVTDYTIPAFTTDLSAAVALCERALPGWWWRVGTCHVSDDATVGPDYNSPVHGERLHREFPPKKLDDGWDEWIFDVDQRPPRSVALALCLAILTAKEATHDRD